MIEKGQAHLQRNHTDAKTNKNRHVGNETSFIQEESQAQKILDTLIEHVVYHGMEMKVLWANRAACQSVGLDLEQVVGRHCYEIWPKRADPCDDCPVMLSRETGLPQSVEKKTPDGRYWHIKCAPLFGTNGKMVAIAEFTIDISERKKMEEALRKSEARHRSLVETIPHGIQEIDPQGAITYANPAHNKIFGYSDQEIIGKSILDMQVSGSAKTELSTYLAKLVEEQPEPTPFTGKNYTKDKRIIDVQVDWNYKKDDYGRVTGFISVITDVSDKKRAEEALQQAHEKLEQRVQERTAELAAFFNNTAVATVVVDPKIRVLKANRAAMEATSRFGEKIVGRYVGEVLGCFYAIDDPRECGSGPFCKTCEVRLAVWESLQSGKPVHEVAATLLLAHEKGRQKLNLLISATPFSILGKDMAVVCLQDVTRRKQTEKRNIELNQTLVQRTNLAEQRAMDIQQLAMELSNAEDRERQRLAGVLHDDFQQMLAYLKIKLTTLPASVEIGNHINTLSKLIDQCIDRCRNFARELKPLGLGRNDFLGALKSLCGQMEKMYGLTVALQAKVAPGIQSSVLSSLLIRSIRELLFNVVKHSGAKHASVDVRVDGRRLFITVKDRGSGCDQGELKEKRDDLGAFGLTDIEDRVNFLGGAMNVECASGQGFCVMLWVPRDVTCSSDTNQPTSDISMPSALKPDGPAVAPVDSLAGRSIRVMLADDHQLMRDGLAGLINEQDGIDVVGMAANGQEVVELAEKLRPDVILMDVSMPVMNGIDATKQISASLPSARIVGLTIHKDSDIHQAMLTAGACACHSKSGSPEELIKTIRLAKSGRTASSRVP